MGEPKYTIYVDWDTEKDEALWRILSNAAQKEIDWNDIAAKFDVTVDFLLKQVAYLTERHASQVRAQVRKATAAAKGSAAPSPVPVVESSTAAERRPQPGQPIGRDSPMPRNEAVGAIRPAISRDGSGNTVSREIAGPPSRPESRQLPSRPSAETAGRRRLSSLPIKAPNPRPAASQDTNRDEVTSPGPADSTSGESSEDESSPAQSRIIRRPPRYQDNDASYQVDDDEDDESEPAFQPYKSSADQNSASDLASTLRGDSRTSTKRGNKHLARERIHQSQTSDSSAGSGALGAEPGKPSQMKSRTSNQSAEQSARSPSGKGKLSSQEGSDGTPSMGSSFSDLDAAGSLRNVPRIKRAPCNYKQSSFYFENFFEKILLLHHHVVLQRNPATKMFRRNWCGLPREVHFPSGLKELGYFVNDEDEVRSIAEPDYYFNYFLSKNSRVNHRQRVQFDAAVQSIIHERLETLGLCKTHLPPLTPGSESKHVNIFISNNLADAKRIVVVFGECVKELGLIASRIAGGPGGIEKGSMVGLVKAIQRRESTGIVLANMGESYWSPEHKRAITVVDSRALSMPSLVHKGVEYHPQVNDIPGSESPLCHARTVLNTVVVQNANENAKINIIAAGDSCEVINSLLDEEKTWEKWGRYLQGALFFSPAFYADPKQAGLKDFLAKVATTPRTEAANLANIDSNQKSRGYTTSEKPLGTPLSGPEGNSTERIPPLGFPCFSTGEQSLDELCVIRALEHGLSYLDEVANTPDYENPAFTSVECAAEEAANAWDEASPDRTPTISAVDENEMRKQVKNIRRMRHFAKTGRVIDSDDESDMDDEAPGSSLPVQPWEEAS
ncbi:hypothetical protein LLEC1_01237 [Akanthomyces lecanii]|uniref:Autophagy-related protein 29 n=1 Tax=Cordyceps confragosa TaxID=2714763 RepID=A0A179IC13_CORDF|nr:hypothetical protein LLEC1_01237 [Akanthomyces lecanii]